jgi:Uncharacterised nucleotidyltransferase
MIAGEPTESVSAQVLSARKPGQPKEWLALLECAAPCPSLHCFRDLIRDSFRWPLLFQYAEEQGVVPLLSALKSNLDHELVPPEVRDKLRELQRAQTLFALQLTVELFRVLEHFAKAGIEVLVTKGPALAVRCYGDPGMRQCSDLDLVLREADIRRATQAMLDLGYQPRIPLTAIDAKKMPGEYAFRKLGTGLLVEFHTEQTFRYHPRRLQIEKLFERRAFVAIDGRRIPALSLEDELVLICVHGAKHFWERLKWIADVAALVSRQPLEWDRAVAVAREVGAERILRLALRIASDVLDAEFPVHINAEVSSDRTVAKLAGQIKTRLASSEPRGVGILQRALFRIRMRGGFLQGAAYLLRLSLSPTEEDWLPGKEATRPAFLDALSRPLRLAKKHSRRSGN